MGYQLKKNHGNLPRRKEDDPFFAIWRHYHDTDVEIVMTDRQKTVCRVYERAKDLYDQGFSEGETAKMVMLYANKLGLSITTRTAYQYLADAKDIFGRGIDIDLSREKYSMIEIGKRLLKKFEEKGADTAASNVFQTLCKLYGFTKESDELSEFLKKAKPISIILTADPESLMNQAKELVEDIEFEDGSAD